MSPRKSSARDTIGHKKRVEEAYDDSAGMYDDTVGRGMASSTNLLLRELQIPENPTVLDVGCGTGISTFELMKRVKGRFFGIDISQKMIDLAREKALALGFSNVEFSKGDAEQLGFPESSFDLIISNLVFHWVQNKQKALKEMFRVLKPRGQVALLFNAGPHYKEAAEIYTKIRNRHPEYLIPDMLKSISLEEAHELFDEAGFQKTRIFAIHQLSYVDPSMFLLDRDATSSWWKIGLPSQVVEMAKNEMLEEATKLKTAKGFKSTSYNIIAIAQKP